MNLIQLLPEWAPNIHPMIVHFPIGLLVFAIVLDLLQWIPRLNDKLGLTTLILYAAGNRADDVLLEHAEIIHVSDLTEPLQLQVAEDEEKGVYLELRTIAEAGPVIILFDITARDVSLEAVVQADDFEGRFGLVYQYHSPDHYGFMDYSGHQVRMSRHENGTDAVLVRNDWQGQGWFAMRAVADGRHLHGYINEEMIVHEHASPWESGRTGLLLDGSGSVRLRSLNLVRLRGQ